MNTRWWEGPLEVERRRRYAEAGINCGLPQPGTPAWDALQRELRPVTPSPTATPGVRS